MSNATETRSIGCDPASDLVLNDTTVSARHACLELTDNGLVLLRDTGSDNGSFLNRNERWVRIRKIRLCIGDRVRIGAVEVSLQQLMTMFADNPGARLDSQHLSPLSNRKDNKAYSLNPESPAALKKPVRNSVTGKIEERSN